MKAIPFIFPEKEIENFSEAQKHLTFVHYKLLSQK
jgi:hypothetical protein